MSIDDIEASVHDSLPIELYEFVGSYKNYFFTSAAEPVVFSGRTYLPVPGMARSDVRAGTSTEDNIVCKVTLPVNTDVIADYGFQVTPPRLFLTVYRLYRDQLPYETNYRIYWKGEVTNISIKGRDAVMDVPSVFASVLASACPSVYFQTPCNFVLYDPDTCKVPRAPNSVDTVIDEVLASGQVLKLLSYGAFPVTEFIAGEVYISSQSERRMVIGADLGTGEITLNYPLGRAVVGTAIQITRGCDHAWQGHCKTRFNNTENNGGHPLVPAINVFETGF